MPSETEWLVWLPRETAVSRKHNFWIVIGVIVVRSGKSQLFIGAWAEKEGDNFPESSGFEDYIKGWITFGKVNIVLMLVISVMILYSLVIVAIVPFIQPGS